MLRLASRQRTALASFLIAAVAVLAAPSLPASALPTAGSADVAAGVTAGLLSESDPGVATARARLAEATEARAAAESRLSDARARRAAIEADLEELSEGAVTITEDLAEARSQVREYAVAAYIDGGQGVVATAALTPTERAEVAWHTQLVGSTTADAVEAIDRFNTLKAINDPARVAAAAQLDAANQGVAAAFNDAVQAGAHERDAEVALTAASAAAQERAAEKAARERAASQAAERESDATDSASSQVPSNRGETSDDTAQAPRSGRVAQSQATPGATAPSAPAPSGSPTAAEAATLAKIRRCESRGNYGIVSSSGRYRGAYQFDRRTWASVGGSGDPAAASPAEQDYRALLLLRQRGTRPWPNCG